MWSPVGGALAREGVWTVSGGLPGALWGGQGPDELFDSEQQAMSWGPCRAGGADEQ